MNAQDTRKQIQRILGGLKEDGDIGPLSRERFDQLAAAPGESQWPPAVTTESTSSTVVGTIMGVKIHQTAAGGFYWTSRATVNADGAPDCYHPDDRPGRDALVCAGGPGHWWGIATDTDHIPGKMGKGRPYIQGIAGCPALAPQYRGFYVSTTALADNPEFPISDQRRYCNALEVAGFVVPRKFPGKVRMGRKGRISYQGRTIDAVVFDVGPADEIGELSIRAAELLGINPSPRSGGAQGGVHYEILP